jgi:mRNA-degrading endonuclease HigB of HigAB toxin-antitoxin module
MITKEEFERAQNIVKKYTLEVFNQDYKDCWVLINIAGTDQREAIVVTRKDIADVLYATGDYIMTHAKLLAND